MNALIPNFLNTISQEIQVLDIAKQRYAKLLAPKFSLFDYIYTDEIMLSKIIADLLNPDGKHAQGTIFLSLFLHLLQIPQHWQELELEQAKIKIEVEKMTKQGRRMDIYINIFSEEKNYGICIENKPFAADGKDQLHDYALEMEQLNPQNWHIVYLSGYDQAPSENSVSSSKLTEWVHDKKYTQISFSSLNNWLKNCLAECQNERVTYFLKEFQNYILNQFIGVNDMSEQDAIINIALSSQQNMQATFELFAAKDKIQDELIKKFQAQLTQAAEKKTWRVTDNFSRDHWSGVNIFFGPNHNFSFRIEFHHYNYRGFFLGISRRNENIKDSELFQRLSSMMSILFPQEKIKRSESWPAYIDQKEWDWQMHQEAWLMIASGELCQRMMNYAEQIYDGLKQSDLLKEF